MTSTVITKYGSIEGLENESCFEFRGVPFAKPPVGELRFHAPLPCEPWEGVRQAKDFPAICPQSKQNKGFYYKEFYTDDYPEMSEDCLYLNIWVPKSVDNCPVAIWFHGGALVGGYGSEKEFCGEEYARRGIVLITVNYRLGMLGFFAHPELTKRDGTSGNYGLLDQIAAIDWVRENIAAFGGDNENITIFGQSAGGMSVVALLSSPLVKGKFKRAIIQSSPFLSREYPDSIKQEKLFAGFLRKSKLSLEKLIDLPAMELQKLGSECNRYLFLRSFRLLNLAHIADNIVIPQAKGDCDPGDVSCIIGSNANDIGKAKSSKRDLMQNNAKKWAKAVNAAGGSCRVYYFKRRLPGSEDGAFHSAELWYMFGTLDRCWRPMTDGDKKLSEKMLDAWAGFFKNGDPGWPEHTAKNPFVMEFDIDYTE